MPREVKKGRVSWHSSPLKQNREVMNLPFEAWVMRLFQRCRSWNLHKSNKQITGQKKERSLCHEQIQMHVAVAEAGLITPFSKLLEYHLRENFKKQKGSLCAWTNSTMFCNHLNKNQHTVCSAGFGGD